MTVNEEFKKLVARYIEEAKLIKQEKKRDSSRRNVIRSIIERGVRYVDELSGYDENDLIGLIGEIVSDDFIVNLSTEPIFRKWRDSGTSKSKGIDLIAREKFGQNWELVLYEAKHMHNEIRNVGVVVSHHLISNKFELGIDEFEYEKTQFNLAHIIIKLGKNIRTGEAMGSDVSKTKEYRQFIQASLRDDNYRLNVVVVVDSKYCNEQTFDRSVSETPNPLVEGKSHFVTLSLIEPMHLEKMTDEMCKNYVGAI